LELKNVDKDTIEKIDSESQTEIKEFKHFAWTSCTATQINCPPAAVVQLYSRTWRHLASVLSTQPLPLLCNPHYTQTHRHTDTQTLQYIEAGYALPKN
jgi:hypothetical protein